MPDMRFLLSGLEAYHESLTKHVTSLSENFQEVTLRWISLDECFAGNAADEFRPVWEGTSQRFHEYTEHTTQILRILSARIEQLRVAERNSGLEV